MVEQDHASMMSDEGPVSAEDDARARAMIHQFSVHKASTLRCNHCYGPVGQPQEIVDLVEGTIYANIERAVEFLKEEITWSICCRVCAALGLCPDCAKGHAPH